MPRRKRSTPQRQQRGQNTVPTIPDEPDDLWHDINGILAERRRRGRTEYLVDWEPNAVTGQTYDPSWQVEVTSDALDEWKATKTGDNFSSPFPSSDAPEAEPESQESQPPRPANWRNLKRSAAAQPSKRKRDSAADKSVATPQKRRRLDRAASPFDGPAPSITTASSAVSPSASPQPSQQTYALDEPVRPVAVVLEKHADFDPSDFHSVAGTNSQSAGFSSQSLSQLESQDAQIILSGTQQDSRQTVPDSQDLLESSVSQTRLSTAPLATQQPSLQVIADSQSDSQPLISGRPPSSAGRFETSAEPASQIPSGQGSLQQSGSNFNQLSTSTEPSRSATHVAEYQSQPPFTPFPDYLTTSGHLATETPSQIHLGESRPGQQTPINSQLSQAAQVTRASSESPASNGNFSQSSQEARRSSPLGAGPPASAPRQSRGVPVSGALVSDPALAQRISSGNMDSSARPSKTSPRRSAEEELSKIFDLDAAGTPSGRPSVQAELDKVFTFDMDSADSVPDLTKTLGEDDLLEHPVAQGIVHPLSQSEVTIQSQPRIGAASSSLLDDQLSDLVAQPLIDPSDISGTLRADLPTEGLLPGTISPADILRAAEESGIVALTSLDDDPFQSAVEFDSSRQPPPMGQSGPGVDEATPTDSLVAQESRDELITLPFQASARDEYMSRLISCRSAIQQYSRHFDEDDTDEPAESLVGQIDDLFKALQNICDFPPDLIGTALEDLDDKGKTKYARDANGKFSFIFELLQGINVDTSALIVARSTELIRLLFSVTKALEINCVSEALEVRESAFQASAAVVRLALPSEQLSPDDFDIIIGFDNSLASSASLSTLGTPSSRVPLVLRLVTMHGIDHIDYKVARDIIPLERRQAILYAIVGGRNLVSDPERGQPEPHEIARAFCDYLNGDVPDPDWVPVPLPDALLMSYVGSQGQPTIPAATESELEKGTKRKLDAEDEEEAKRQKTAVELDLSTSNPDPPIPEEVLNMLDAINPGDEALAARPTTVAIHIVMLQLLAEQIVELERQQKSKDLDEATKAVIESQAKQLKSYERSYNKIYSKYRLALSDRQLFEKQTREAQQKLQDTEKRAEKNAEKLEQRIATIEADKARLLGSEGGVEGQESPLAANEKLLKEAQEKVKVLEKRLVNAREESEYIRDQYRSAQSAAGETGQLRAQLKKAEEEAGRNKVRIHEINVSNSTRGYLSRISELETQLKERDAELDRAREELRASKNGRRETRQSSVPRSPRMGVLSPRAPARSYPSSTSRGGSPVPVGMDIGNVAGGSVHPGMQLLPQTPANGRWNQL